MREIDQAELISKLEQKDSFVFFLFTPMCGTCKIAERMIHVIAEMLPDVPISKGNINLLSGLATRWQITSVPCLLRLYRGKEQARIYAMHSVEHLYQFINALTLDLERNFDDT
jgi:thiol-disulfide isomerase/thioredoxin